jgi:hypothetical protein
VSNASGVWLNLYLYCVNHIPITWVVLLSLESRLITRVVDCGWIISPSFELLTVAELYLHHSSCWLWLNYISTIRIVFLSGVVLWLDCISTVAAWSPLDVRTTAIYNFLRKLIRTTTLTARCESILFVAPSSGNKSNHSCAVARVAFRSDGVRNGSASRSKREMRFVTGLASERSSLHDVTIVVARCDNRRCTMWQSSLHDVTIVVARCDIDRDPDQIGLSHTECTIIFLIKNIHTTSTFQSSM